MWHIDFGSDHFHHFNVRYFNVRYFNDVPFNNVGGDDHCAGTHDHNVARHDKHLLERVRWRVQHRKPGIQRLEQ